MPEKESSSSSQSDEESDETQGGAKSSSSSTSEEYFSHSDESSEEYFSFSESVSDESSEDSEPTLEELSGNDEEASENLDLDTNKTSSIQFLDTLVEHMAQSPDLTPYQRIVFNACLTNSNEVNLPDNYLWHLPARKQRRETRKYITRNPSLATYLSKRVKDKNIRVIGANGSTFTVTLVNDDGGLDIVTDEDKKITDPDKLVYVEHGTEPYGVLLAVMECWSGLGAEVMYRKKRQQACFDAMLRRTKADASANWEETIIRSLFRIILDNYWHRPEVIQHIAEVASVLSHLNRASECYVDELDDAGLLPGGRFGEHAKGIFADLAGTTEWPQRNYLRLVVEQAWMMHEPKHKKNMMMELNAFTGQTISPSYGAYLDYDQIEPHLSSLLGSGDHSLPAKVLLACKFLMNDASNTDASSFLKTVIGPNNRFLETLNISAILQGSPDEEVILQKLNLMANANAPQNANFDLDDDGQNEIYIPPSSNPYGTLHTEASIYAQPDEASKPLGSLQIMTHLRFLGETKGFYAFRYTKAKSGVAFVATNKIGTMSASSYDNVL